MPISKGSNLITNANGVAIGATKVAGIAIGTIIVYQRTADPCSDCTNMQNALAVLLGTGTLTNNAGTFKWS